MIEEMPALTKVRWACLLAFKRQKVLMTRPFLPHELMYGGRRSGMTPARGPTMVALERAGWVRRTVWGGAGQGMPFRSGGPVNAWEITEAGRVAIDACPDTFPGEPVYGAKG